MEAPTRASIPFLITHAMKDALRARGHSDEEIIQLTPEDAHKILATPDVSAVREFLATIVAQARAATKHLTDEGKDAGLLQMFLVHPLDEDTVVPYRYALDDPDLIERMTREAVGASQAGHNVYIEARTVRRGLTGKQRGGHADTIAVFALVVDSDADKGEGWTPAVPVSLTVETSPDNAHCWLFCERALDPDTGKRLGELLRAASGADSDTGNICQPYRVAGTVNYPGKKKLERGRIVTWTRVLEFDPEVLWTPERFEAEFHAPANGGGASANGKAPDEGDIPAEIIEAIRSTEKGGRGQILWNVVKTLKEDGWTITGIVALLGKYPNGLAVKFKGRLQREIERIYNKIKIGVGAEADAIEVVCAADVEMKAVDWIWSNHFARGKVTIFAGEKAGGKSLMTTDFAARITKVGEWPDGDAAPLGNVVILSSEDAIKDTIVPRLAAAGADLKRVHCVPCVKTPEGVSRTFNLQTDLARLGEKIREIGDVLFVIFDPITSYMGADVDSHRTVEVRAVLEPVGRFAEEHNVCVLAISHPPKAPQGKAINAIVGSGAFVHMPRLAFLAIEDPETPSRILLLALANNIGRKAEGLGYRILDDRFVGPGDSIRAPYVEWDGLPVQITADEALAAHANKRKGGSALSEAEEFLRTRLSADGRSSKEIQDEADALGISERTLKRARKKLGVRAEKDAYAEGWRLFFDKDAPSWRKRAGGDTNGDVIPFKQKTTAKPEQRPESNKSNEQPIMSWEMDELKTRGFTPDDVFAMSPERARSIIADPDSNKLTEKYGKGGDAPPDTVCRVCKRLGARYFSEPLGPGERADRFPGSTPLHLKCCPRFFDSGLPLED